jgi:hypothetical protein
VVVQFTIKRSTNSHEPARKLATRFASLRVASRIVLFFAENKYPLLVSSLPFIFRSPMLAAIVWEGAKFQGPILE